MTVPDSDKPRFRTRKGRISTNVLGVCNRDMNFVYVLSGWEGSASDSRILRDAITRRNSLKIPLGMCKKNLKKLDYLHFPTVYNISLLIYR